MCHHGRAPNSVGSCACAHGPKNSPPQFITTVSMNEEPPCRNMNRDVDHHVAKLKKTPSHTVESVEKDGTWGFASAPQQGVDNLEEKPRLWHLQTVSCTVWTMLVQTDQCAWHRRPEKKLQENSAKCSVTSKTSHAHATVVNNERCCFREALQHGLADKRREHSGRASSRALRAPEPRTEEAQSWPHPRRRSHNASEHTSTRTMKSESKTIPHRRLLDHKDVRTVSAAQYLHAALRWRWLLHLDGSGGAFSD